MNDDRDNNPSSCPAPIKLPRLAASQSFTAEEARWLDALLSTIRRGGDTRVLMRNPAAASVQRKVDAMKRRVEEVRAMRAEVER